MGNQHVKPTNANDGHSSPSSTHNEPEPTRNWFEFRAELKELWKNRDRNQNGRLDPEEVKGLVEDGVKTLTKGIANDAKKTAELVEDFVKDLDVDKDGKIGFNDFEKTVKKYLARSESNAVNWFVDGLQDFAEEIRTSIHDFDQHIKDHIKNAIVEAVKSDNGILDEILPILIAKMKSHVKADPDVMNALEVAARDYEWLEQKFIAFDQTVKPLEKRIGDKTKWFDDNRPLVLGVLGIALLLPYLAILKYLFF